VNYPGGRLARRRRSRPPHRIRISRRTAISTVMLVLLLSAGWLGFNRNHPSSEMPQPVESVTKGNNLAVLAGPVFRPIKISGSNRPIYNYSVVRGGVHSPQELREATRRDSQVAAHYAGFRFEKARIVQLKAPVLVYLSYRKKDRILWTKTKHRLKAGEPVITDGEITGRTRCANRISVRKQLAVSPEPDPSPVELDQIEAPSIPPVLVSYPAQYQTALLEPPTNPGTPSGPGGLVGGIGPFFPGGGGGGGIPGGGGGGGTPGPPGGGGGGGTPGPPGGGGGDGGGGGGGGCPPGAKDCPPPPPTPVPEPGTIVLVSSGLATLALLRKKLIQQ
jgi:hypothetical protein